MMRTHFQRLLSGIFLLSVAAMGYCQFTFGPKVSINFTNVLHETEMKPGFDAGIFFRFGRSFYFQPELDYSFRSSTFKTALSELKENARLKNHYLDIPLLIGYKIVDGPNFNFRVFIGPRLGILVGNKSSWKKDEALGTVQIGGRTGIGIDFWRFTLDVNYDFSASKYNSIPVKWWKQNMVNIALGFKIIKKE